VHSAGVQDRDGAVMLIARLSHLFSYIKHIWADGAYAGELPIWVRNLLGWTIQIVKRSDTCKGFILLPRRWVVERTFAWLCNYRLNAKDYCHSAKCSEAALYAASVNIMLRRIYPK
jgi:putative transposase